jgi:hypothetical protein
MVKLHVFGNNSKTVNNIRNLTWVKMIRAAIFVGGMGRNEETL